MKKKIKEVLQLEAELFGTVIEGVDPETNQPFRRELFKGMLSHLLTMKTKHQLNKLSLEVQKECEGYRKVYTETLKKHAKLKDDGNVEVDEKGQIVWLDGGKLAFEKQHTDLMELEVDLAIDDIVKKIPFDEIAEIKSEHNYPALLDLLD